MAAAAEFNIDDCKLEEQTAEQIEDLAQSTYKSKLPPAKQSEVVRNATASMLRSYAALRSLAIANKKCPPREQNK